MSTQNVNLDELKYKRLSPIYDLSKFDCGDNDLNEFLREDAFKHQDNSIAFTWLVFHKEELVSFFSLSCDSVKLSKEFEKKDIDGIGLSYPDYPAIKIARMGTSVNFKNLGIGSRNIKEICGRILTDPPIAAVRFITPNVANSL